MPFCVRCLELDPYSKTEGKNLFKGRFLCLPHFEQVMKQLSGIVDEKQSREKRTLASEEIIGVQSPRLVHDEFGRVARIRGQHVTIKRSDLAK